MVGRGQFFGRDSLVRSIADGITKNRSFALCGGPRTGRTSTLHQVVHTIHARWQRAPRATKVVPVLLDLQSIKQPRQLPQMLWSRVVEEIRSAPVAGENPAPAPTEQFRRAPDGWKHLQELLIQMWEALRGSTGWCEWALLLDNADALFDRALRPAVEPLVTLFSQEEVWAPASITLAGGRALREHLLDPEADFYFLRPLLLGALRDGEAEALIRGGFEKLPGDTVNSLLASTGKHPFVLQRVLWELQNHGLSIGVEGAVDRAAGDLLDQFERIWAALDFDRGVTYRGAYAAPEHALMQLLIDFPEGCDVKTSERELGLKPLKEFAELLELLGVAERVIAANDVLYRAQLELWNIWYRERIMR